MKELTKFIKIRDFPKENYKAVLINGKTLRFCYDNKKPIKDLKYPEFYDIKITNRCSGKCEYCYMNSKENEEHYPNIISKIKDFFGKLNSNQRPFQIACLHKETNIYTDKGVKYVKDISIGDYVLNDIGEKLKVIKIKETYNKKLIKIIGNKNFSIKCTPDHLFSVNNKMVMAKDLKGKILDIGKYLRKDFVPYIDISKYINKTSRIKGKRGGSSGGKIIGDKCRLMHTLSFIPSKIPITKDLMWLYGITVAEGYKRGISLHKQEINLANKASKIYNNIFGLKSKIRISNSNINTLIVEFNESKNYSTLFFDAMKIGRKGDREKSIKFLFNIPTYFVKYALIGMFDGDGCYRTRKVKGNIYRCVCYKTSSYRLANEIIYLLATRFGIQASLYCGESKKRYIGKREISKTKYYSVEIYGKDNIKKIFNTRVKNFYNVGKSKYSHRKPVNFIKINEIKDCKNDNVYDIYLEKSSNHLFTLDRGVITHNCGGGNPNEHPDFVNLLKEIRDLGIIPNYTSNGMGLTNEILNATKKYCGGIALSTHKHLEKYWKKSFEKCIKLGIKTNLHIIISDKESIDDFLELYKKYNKDIYYFVLLPYVAQGRAIKKEVCYDYFFEKFNELKDINKIAFGAKFYAQLIKRKIKAYLYEPEIFSKFLDLKDMKIYNSSFSINE